MLTLNEQAKASFDQKYLKNSHLEHWTEFAYNSENIQQNSISFILRETGIAENYLDYMHGWCFHHFTASQHLAEFDIIDSDRNL